MSIQSPILRMYAIFFNIVGFKVPDKIATKSYIRKTENGEIKSTIIVTSPIYNITTTHCPYVILA